MNKNIKRIIAVLTLCIILAQLVLCFASCSGKDDPEAASYLEKCCAASLDGRYISADRVDDYSTEMAVDGEHDDRDMSNQSSYVVIRDDGDLTFKAVAEADNDSITMICAGNGCYYTGTTGNIVVTVTEENKEAILGSVRYGEIFAFSPDDFDSIEMTDSEDGKKIICRGICDDKKQFYTDKYSSLTKLGTDAVTDVENFSVTVYTDADDRIIEATVEYRLTMSMTYSGKSYSVVQNSVENTVYRYSAEPDVRIIPPVDITGYVQKTFEELFPAL